MNKKDNILSSALIALIVTVILGISGMDVAHAEIPEKVKIGGIFDKNWAEGDESSRVIEIAVNNFNEYLEELDAHWRFYISIEDAASQSAVAFEKIQGFKGKGVDIITGMAFSSHINLAASYIDKNDILVLSHASQATNLAIDDSIFRMVPNDGNQAPAVVKMLNDAEINVLVPVIRNDVWGNGLLNEVKKLYNGTIEPETSYSPDVSEFSVMISSLDEQIGNLFEVYDADEIGVFYVGTDEFLPIIQQMELYENVAEVRWFSTHTQSIKTYFFEDESAIDFARDVQFTATRSIPSDSNNIREHVDMTYMNNYNSTVSTYGYAAYDSIWLLGYTILQTQTIDTNTLANIIPHVAGHMIGASGDLTLTEYGDLARANFEVWQVQNSTWVQLSD